MTAEPPPPPPPPPTAGAATATADPATARRRGRRRMLVIAAAALVIATPVVLAVLAAASAPPTEQAGSPGRSGPAGTDAWDAERQAADASRLSGRDAAWARLLAHIDESERAMLGFQEQVRGIVDEADELGREASLERVGRAADAGAAELAEVRPRLAAAIADGPVEEVRAAYLAHHDAWADYLDAVAQTPAVLGEQVQGWHLSIDSSGAAFARQLREAMAESVDPAVRAHAREILRRGFGEDLGDTTDV